MSKPLRHWPRPSSGPDTASGRDTVVVTVEQLVSTFGDIVASTVPAKAPCTNAECIGSKMSPRYAKGPAERSAHFGT